MPNKNLGNFKRFARLLISFNQIEKIVKTLFIVAATTAVLYLIGRETLGEGVIALLYLAPISWISARWGKGAGIPAAIASALAFNFYFIPPFYTLYIGSLEGWLLLGIFLAVAILIVGRIQIGFKQAQQREFEAVMMYEFSLAIAGAHSREAIARALAHKIHEVYQAGLTQVILDGNVEPIVVSIPRQASIFRKPDRVAPIIIRGTLSGEVRLWLGEFSVTDISDRLMNNFTNQSALTIERAQMAKTIENAS